MTHLELLHHFTSETYKTFVANEDEMNVGYIIIKYALSAPFLMYEVLAIAALHLSICRPERRSFFRQQSAELLGQALADFQKIDKQMNAKTISPAFLFSGLVGFQFFFDTFFSSHTDLDCFLDQLVHSINLLRGVRAVLGNWWSVLQDSELKPLLDIDDPPGYVGDSTSERFEKLRGLVREANLSPCLVKACEGAIDQLIWVHKLELVGNSMFTFRNPRRVIAWPITVSAEYTELLAQREPVALIILAHYAILLDNYREYWAIGTAGQLLLSSIEVYLGQPWEDWLVWLKASVSSVH
ncbi:MAG: hypothetical protein M1834_007948 [Cirrosporium novae-zelandiae]|nr:MAG: hypothetical protein M1834_007948 [Cirrosporium novae-zelandiae]